MKLPEVGPVYVGNFTGSANADVVVAPGGCWGRGGDKYYMLLGDGHGNLTPGPVYESPVGGACGWFVGDFTKTGRDALVAQTNSPSGIFVLPGQPDGSLGPPVVTPTPQFASRLAFLSAGGDLDGDGIPDLVVRIPEERMGRIQVFKGNGAGAFSEAGS